jgi:5'-nucleotidase
LASDTSAQGESVFARKENPKAIQLARNVLYPWLRGADLLAALENGVSQPGAGRFLQLAGLRLVWDPASPAGRRVVSATVTGGERAGPVDPERVYLIVTNSFMRAGGDGYTVFRDRALEFYDTGPLLEEVVAGWMGARSPLEPRTDGRIMPR